MIPEDQNPIAAAAEAIVFAHETGDGADAPLPVTAAAALERAAALATAALVRPMAPPPGLAARLAEDALRYCARNASRRPASPTRFVTPRRVGPRPLTMFLSGAAAAGFLSWLALAPTPSVPLHELRQRALAEPARTLRLDWNAGPSTIGQRVEGDVVWRTDWQDGWLRFRGLPPLPPNQRYQLWIVDAERQGAPVDGGLFDAPADGDTLVKIDARLPIGDPKGFVVTVEDRRGAVVSGQEQVVVTAMR
jgi:hypothetical protein